MENYRRREIGWLGTRCGAPVRLTEALEIEKWMRGLHIAVGRAPCLYFDLRARIAEGRTFGEPSGEGAPEKKGASFVSAASKIAVRGGSHHGCCDVRFGKA